MTDYTTLTDEQLSALVAEKVLGITQYQHDYWECDDPFYTYCQICGDKPKFEERETRPTCKCPDYLTWTGIGLIVEAMRGKGYAYSITGAAESQWNTAASFSKDNVTTTKGAPKAPRAVAIAACRALEDKEPRP